MFVKCDERKQGGLDKWREGGGGIRMEVQQGLLFSKLERAQGQKPDIIGL